MQASVMHSKGWMFGYRSEFAPTKDSTGLGSTKEKRKGRGGGGKGGENRKRGTWEEGREQLDILGPLSRVLSFFLFLFSKP